MAAGPQPGRDELPQPRVRGARGGPRGTRRATAAAAAATEDTMGRLATAFILARAARVAGVAAGAGGRAAGRPRGRALPPLRGRRRHDRRPVAAGAQEGRREVLGLRQLLRRHGLECFDRRADHGEPLRGDAQAGQPRARCAERQDAVQRELHQQRRGRLHGEHRQLRPQPGTLRRPHHPVARLQPRLGRGAQARRLGVRGTRRPPQLPARPFADRHADADAWASPSRRSPTRGS